jgi:hypothetical protein
MQVSLDGRNDRQQEPAKAFDGAASGRSSTSNPAGAESEAIFQRLRADLVELGESAWQLVRIYGLRASLGARRAFFNAALILLGAVLALTMVVVASVFVLAGMAGGFAQLFGGQLWAGLLASGVLVLAVIIGGAELVRVRASQARAETVRKLLARGSAEAKSGTNGSSITSSSVTSEVRA